MAASMMVTGVSRTWRNMRPKDSPMMPIPVLEV